MLRPPGRKSCTGTIKYFYNDTATLLQMWYLQLPRASVRGHSHLEGGFTKETSSFGGRGGEGGLEKTEKLLIDFCLFLEFTGLKLDCENF